MPINVFTCPKCHKTTESTFISGCCMACGYIDEEQQQQPMTAEQEKHTVQTDPISKPAHYTFGNIQPIEVIEDWGLGFCLGNCVKYIARAPYKGTELDDLRKAAWYLARRIQQLEASSPENPNACGFGPVFPTGVRQVVTATPVAKGQPVWIAAPQTEYDLSALFDNGPSQPKQPEHVCPNCGTKPMASLGDHVYYCHFCNLKGDTFRMVDYAAISQKSDCCNARVYRCYPYGLYKSVSTGSIDHRCMQCGKSVRALSTPSSSPDLPYSYSERECPNCHNILRKQSTAAHYICSVCGLRGDDEQLDEYVPVARYSRCCNSLIYCIYNEKGMSQGQFCHKCHRLAE